MRTQGSLSTPDSIWVPGAFGLLCLGSWEMDAAAVTREAGMADTWMEERSGTAVPKHRLPEIPRSFQKLGSSVPA